MARGINRVILSGTCSENARFHETGRGEKCGTFRLASDRRGAKPGEIVTAKVKVNIYGDALVELCKDRLLKGDYVIVEGELMNRDGAQGQDLIEVRAKEIVFTEWAD